MSDNVYYKLILSPTTAAGESEDFSLAVNNTATITVCGGLQGDEFVIIQKLDPINNVFMNCPSLVITATTDPYLDGFSSAGKFRIAKSVTINSVGITLEQNQINNNVVL